MDKNELIENFKDHLKFIDDYYYTESEHYSGDIGNCEVSVIEADCIDIAYKESFDNDVMLLNMASYKHPGGGVLKGSRAQEEEICRRTTLYKSLEKIKYPWNVDDYYVSYGVKILKDSNYKMLSGVNTVDVLSISAIKKSKFKGTEDKYNYLMDLKVQQILNIGAKHYTNVLVLSAFGCGAYGNDPEYVAKLFKKHLPRFKCLYSKIIFAIYNDHNAVKNNYQIFKNIINAN